jgi:phosphatidylethanolamine/phosphatidyl-N-methylethanolamine N-methyltransferase
VGGLFPSSSALAGAITDAVRELGPDLQTPLIEVGPGTGALTTELAKLGHPLYLLERSAEFAHDLAARFPSAVIFCDDFLTSELFGRVSAGAVVVSSLPIRSLPKPGRFRARFKSLLDGGQVRAVIQFSYGFRDPLGFGPEEVLTQRYRFVVKNFPPAFVWVYRAKV